MSYVPIGQKRSAGLAGCGCMAGPPYTFPGAGEQGRGLGFSLLPDDISSYFGGLSTAALVAAAAVGGLLLFSPGAKQRRSAISEEKRRHREALKGIKRKYKRLPTAITYEEWD